MKKKILFIVILIYSTALFAESTYQKGVKAYQAKEYSSALKYFYISARHYNVNAYNMLGIIHEEGLGTGVNKRTAFYWYEKAARRRHPEAQYHLGHLYETGDGVKKDMKKAGKWYRQAAAHGSKKAKLRLAKKEPVKNDSNESKGFFGSFSFWN